MQKHNKKMQPTKKSRESNSQPEFLSRLFLLADFKGYNSPNFNQRFYEIPICQRPYQ